MHMPGRRGRRGGCQVYRRGGGPAEGDSERKMGFPPPPPLWPLHEEPRCPSSSSAAPPPLFLYGAKCRSAAALLPFSLLSLSLRRRAEGTGWKASPSLDPDGTGHRVTNSRCSSWDGWRAQAAMIFLRERRDRERGGLGRDGGVRRVCARVAAVFSATGGGSVRWF